MGEEISIQTYYCLCFVVGEGMKEYHFVKRVFPFDLNIFVVVVPNIRPDLRH